MGGSNSVDQSREFVKTAISQTVVDTVNSKTLNVTQRNTVNQVIEGVVVLQKEDCPMFERSGGTVDIQNKANLNMQAIVNTKNMDTVDLSRKVT